MRRHAPDARAARRGRACRPSLRHHRRRLCLGRAGARRRPCMACCGGSRRATGSRSTPGRMSRPASIAPRRCRCASAASCVPALVYFARPRGEGRPKPGYIELVVAAAREWDLPEAYIRSLEAWRRRAPLGAGNAQARRIPVSVDPPRRVSRPGAGRGLPRLRRGRGGAARPRRAGCATAATARSRRCSPARQRDVDDMIAACRKGPPPRASTASMSARPTPDELALRGQGHGSRCCRPSDSCVSGRSARTAPRTRAAAPCRPRPC